MEENLKDLVHRYLIRETDFLKVKDAMNEDQLRVFVDKAINDLCYRERIPILPEQRQILVRALVSAVISLGPLRPLIEDESITEIMINGCDKVYIQKDGHIHLTDIKFADNRQLAHTIQKILSGSGSNKRVDESSPYVDFSLADGSRVNVIIPPCSNIGPVMTIRKFKKDINEAEDLLHLKMLNKDISVLLKAAMEAKLNVIFCGSTGAGKTTILNVFSKYIPEDERIITIEDTPELRLKQQHVVPLVTKPANVEGKGEITMRELFVNSLRMRPDRIIVGEVRGEEILDFIQSISSGHSGSLAIVHAESPEDCYNRMVTMMLMTGIRLSTAEIQKQIARAVDLIVHVELFMDGRRRVTTVSDIRFDEEKNKIILQDIFAFKTKGMNEHGEIQGEWTMNKQRPSFYYKIEKRRVKLPQGFFNV
ncbi:MAG TPA: ATPase, T2SS/T4P/T4SS family [Candidatus Omnitrophota bacterium]|nr:ATPase, T2SS/T4P/T4SS family [Candidatus Omnitrophota bacterium]